MWQHPDNSHWEMWSLFWCSGVGRGSRDLRCMKYVIRTNFAVHCSFKLKCINKMQLYIVRWHNLVVCGFLSDNFCCLSLWQLIFLINGYGIIKTITLLVGEYRCFTLLFELYTNIVWKMTFSYWNMKHQVENSGDKG